jgi:hypothetical protein
MLSNKNNKLSESKNVPRASAGPPSHHQTSDCKPKVVKKEKRIEFSKEYSNFLANKKKQKVEIDAKNKL